MNHKVFSVFFLLSVSFINVVQSVKFGYVLETRQMQCFHQSAQKGTRYQIDIKGSQGLYSLMVNQNSPVHTDTRTDQSYKYFSAFANSNSGVTFCVNSLTDSPVELQVEFYHGFYLQNGEQIKVANQFIDITRRMEQISNMIKMNYNKYKSQIIQRQPYNDRIEIYGTFAIIIFLLVVIVVKLIYFSKTVKFMKARKIM